ncbi:MAG: hypothetical protein K6B54_03390 [Clostridia bacterium]|nr:hypothetical protein [Clostridia bacterium]
MLDKIIVDADFCVKLGGSEKYDFLFQVLPLIAGDIYMHTHAAGKCCIPPVQKSNLLI